MAGPGKTLYMDGNTSMNNVMWLCKLHSPTQYSGAVDDVMMRALFGLPDLHTQRYFESVMKSAALASKGCNEVKGKRQHLHAQDEPSYLRVLACQGAHS